MSATSFPLAVQSLREIQSQHPSLLVIDAASSVIHVGLIDANGTSRWAHREGEASSTCFALIEELGADIDSIDGFVFCEGPGSMLGIRTVAAVLRTWTALQPRPVWSYRSLELCARAHGEVGAAFICDARRQSWFRLVIADNEGNLTPIERVKTGDLSGGALPEGFRTWTPLPNPPPYSVPYEPALLTSDLFDAPLLRECPDPDAFQDEAPSYVQWTPAIHQAPPPKS